mmetsp:Transcript_24549/g.60333  ORF Transcript_24549/g.60333 Transcript_24549/m.60333 type:complete len:224 (-) Transcript_24549:256-927(-)
MPRAAVAAILPSMLSPTTSSAVTSSPSSPGISALMLRSYFLRRSAMNWLSITLRPLSVACPTPSTGRRTCSGSLLVFSLMGMKSPLKMLPTATKRVQLSRRLMAHWLSPWRSSMGTAMSRWLSASSRRRYSSQRSMARSPMGLSLACASRALTSLHSAFWSSHFSSARALASSVSFTCRLQPDSFTLDACSVACIAALAPVRSVLDMALNAARCSVRVLYATR